MGVSWLFRMSEEGTNRPFEDPDAASRTDAARTLSGAHLAPFFEGLPATVWMTDHALTLTFIQGSLLRFLRIDASRLIGRTLPDLLMGGREDHPLIQGHLTALGGHETSVRIEWGGRIYYARLAPVRDPAQRVIGCVGVQQEIGWLPDDEGTLRESDIRLQRVVDSNMIGIAFGNDEGQITDANEAFLQLAGYAREDLVADGISWPALAPIEFHQRQLSAIDEIRRTGRCAPFETELIRKDGQRITVLVGGARLSTRRREGVAFVLDITERRRLRQRLRAELACADVLLATDSPKRAIPEVLAAASESLGWQGALAWMTEDCYPALLVGRWGDPGTDDAVLAALGRHAADAAETMWSATARTLFVPLANGPRVMGVLAFVSRPGAAPDPETIDASKGIAARLARALGQSS
jgi:PAS domain S-box-containing protein